MQGPHSNMHNHYNHNHYQLKDPHSPFQSLPMLPSLAYPSPYQPAYTQQPQHAYSPSYNHGSPHFAVQQQSHASSGASQGYQNSSHHNGQSLSQTSLPSHLTAMPSHLTALPTPAVLPPPASYTCKLCSIPNHWMRECPLYRQKRPTQNVTPPQGYTCRKCNIDGHWIQHCTFKASSPPSTYTCRICLVKGHWIQQCQVGQMNIRTWPSTTSTAYHIPELLHASSSDTLYTPFMTMNAPSGRYSHQDVWSTPNSMCPMSYAPQELERADYAETYDYDVSSFY